MLCGPIPPQICPTFKKDIDYHVAADLTGQANQLAACRTWDVEKRKSAPTRTVLAAFLPHSPATGQEGGEKWTAAVDLQPTIPKSHRLLGVTLEADIIKQKLPENNGGYLALNTKENPYGKNDKRMYSDLASEHPIDLARYQVANCYMGRAGLINSGGASGANDLHDAVRTAVINKRAGGMGLISGRKAFQKPMAEGVTLLNAIQDVYLASNIGVA